MQKIVCARIGIKRFTPVMVDSNQPSVKYDGQSMGHINWDNIHNPDRLINKSCGKSEREGRDQS